MEGNLMDALLIVKKDLIKDGMPEKQADLVIRRMIWTLICRL